MRSRVSLGKRLRLCPSFSPVGVLPNWEDYPSESRETIKKSDEVYYPSAIYEDVLLSLGKGTFPRNYYRFMGNKIIQTHLFQLLGISHPRTRLYYGKNRMERIRADFEHPFIAKKPVGSSKGEGVYLIRGKSDLAHYLEICLPAYIQEYLSIDRDLRVVLIGGKVIHAYWRIPAAGEFRNNLARGAAISYDDIPREALAFASEVAARCRFDEVGLDICYAKGRYFVIEANMAFGLEGFRKAGMNIHEVLARMDLEGLLQARTRKTELLI